MSSTPSAGSQQTKKALETIQNGVSNAGHTILLSSYPIYGFCVIIVLHMQPPLWWLFFVFSKKMCYICGALHLVRALHIESVFAVLQENVEVFKN